MERTLSVSGKEIRFKCSGLTPKIYRSLFGREFFSDIQSLMKNATSGEDYTIESLEAFERLAYVMARQADPSAVPADMDEWLDSLDGLAIYQVLPELVALWGLSAAQTAQPKKK